jgi:hypothetical protein
LKGDYYIFAFGDRNKNLVYEKGEMADQYGKPDAISTVNQTMIHGLNIKITNSNTDVDFPYDSVISEKRPEKLHSTAPGAIADLDDELFSNEYGRKGYWRHSEFFEEVGGNIYFLEKYDPSRIPILFVHGAAGSPQNWRYCG